MSSTGAYAASGTTVAGGRVDRGCPRDATPIAERAIQLDVPFGDRLRGRLTCWSSTSRRASSCIRRAATGPGRSPRRCRARGGRRGPWRAGIVHRLDRDTSGLLVVAQAERCTVRLKRSLAAHSLRREYLALVDGRPSARTGTIDAPIGRDRRDRTLMSIDTDDPREARTHFEIERVAARRDAVASRGWRPGARTRSGCTWRRSGIPLRRPAVRRPARYGLTRQFLHAARLAFPIPSPVSRSTSRRRCPTISSPRSSWPQEPSEPTDRPG